MEESIELGDLTPPGINLLKYVKFPEIWLDIKKKCIGWFSRPFKIVVYGESGSGKTQFLHTILELDTYSEQRTQDFKIYKFQLPDGHKIEFIDTPGNKTLSSVRADLRKRFNKGEISGIINIVANGYQSSPDVDLSQVFRAGTNIVKPDYLRSNRKMELDQLEEWKDYVDADSHVKWFITVVNKADIWYKDKKNTMDYYQGGDYFASVKELKHVCSLKFFPFCSIIAPFCGRTMELVMSQKDQREMHREFFSGLSDLIKDAKR